MGFNKYLENQEFVDNVAKRIPVCIVVDCSGSMGEYDGTSKKRIERVNDGIRLFYDGVQKNSKAKMAVEVLFVAVGNEAHVLGDFASTDKTPPELYYYHQKNNLTEGVRVALKALDGRKNKLSNANIDYYQPWLIIMSDGGVNREFSKEEFRTIQSIVRERELGGKLSVFPVYVQGKPVWDDDAERYVPISPETYDIREKIMSEFSNQGMSRLINIDLADSSAFEKLFQFLHKSASSVANNGGIIKDANYGNFEQSYGNAKNISSGELYDYEDPVGYEESDMYEELEKNRKIIEEFDKKKALEKEEIAKLRKALSKKTKANTTDIEIKPQRVITEIFINQTKSFPIKKYDGNNVTLSIRLVKGDKVSIVRNGSNVIYEMSARVDNKYHFVVDENNVVQVLQDEIESQSVAKNKKIEVLNQEIQTLIETIPNWDDI